VAKKVEVLAKKGSQKWLQVVVNETPDVLNAQIITQLKLLQTETITWLSPLAADDFAEYQDQTFLDLLQIKLPNVSLNTDFRVVTNDYFFKKPKISRATNPL